MRRSRRALFASRPLVARALALTVAAAAGLALAASAPAEADIELGSLSVNLMPVATGLVSPIGLTNAGDSRLFVTDQVGEIRVIENGQLLATPFLDIRSKLVELRANYDERGLLGVAFHPDFQSNGKLYVNYSAPGAPEGWNHHTVIAEYTASPGTNVVDPTTERIVLTYDQPQSNHNGGQLAFGSDGFLYIASGDGGGANDVGPNHTPVTGNGQDKTKLLGKLLRIDVDNQAPGQEYAVPLDNPFIAEPGARPEIYAYGFRNPYAFSFDRGGANDLFLADVGQNMIEEVNIVVSGGNYGWKAKEGTTTFDPNLPQEGYIDPIAEYTHADGSTVIGGYVYRGTALPYLEGAYVFGDFSADIDFQNPEGRARMFYLPADQLAALGPESGLIDVLELQVGEGNQGLQGLFLKGFGQGADGELYALVSTGFGPSGNGGMVMQIVPEPSSFAALGGMMASMLTLARRRRQGAGRCDR